MAKRRIWQTPDGIVCLRDEDLLGEEIVREFWVPREGGHVRQVDDKHPGTLGYQVCDRLYGTGPTLRSDRASLLDLIRREYRRRCAQERRERGRDDRPMRVGGSAHNPFRDNDPPV